MGWGFADYGRSLLRQNKILRERIFKWHFVAAKDKPHAELKSKKRSIEEYTTRKQGQYFAEQKRKKTEKRIKMIVVLIILVCLSLFIGFYSGFEKIY